MVSLLNPIVGNCLAYSSTSWRSFEISDWKWADCIVTKKSFNFVPGLQAMWISGLKSLNKTNHDVARYKEALREQGKILKIYKPLVSAFIFTANFTEASKKSATLAKSSSTNPLEVRAGVPDVQLHLSRKFAVNKIKEHCRVK
jgi:hypothetical protein